MNIKLSHILLLIWISSYLPVSAGNADKDEIIVLVKFDNPAYKDSLNGNLNVRNYVNTADPSYAGEFNLPSKNILVALPPNSQPEVEVVEYNVTIVNNTIPAITPDAKFVNDSTIIGYEQIVTLPLHNKRELVEVVDYGYLRDIYCAHLKINYVQFDPQNMRITEYDSIRIKLSFNVESNFTQSSKNENKTWDNVLSPLIYNYENALRYKNRSDKIESVMSDPWFSGYNEYLKIAVGEDNLYRISFEDLIANHVDINSIDYTTFQLFNKGREVPILTKTGADSLFQEGDYIEFYAEKNYNDNLHRVINDHNQEYNEYLNRYTDSSYYFLVWGARKSSQVPREDGSPVLAADTIDYFRNTVHVEENPFDVLQFLNSDNLENQLSSWNRNRSWYWLWLDASWAPVRQFDVNLDNLYPESTAKFLCKLVSGGSNVGVESHDIQLEINDIIIDEQIVNRYEQALLTGDIGSDEINNGTNTLNVRNINNGTFPNYLAIDWVEYEYTSFIQTDDDSLIFMIDNDVPFNLYNVKISGVDSENLVIFQVSPQMQKIENFRYDGTSILFSDSLAGGYKYIITKPAKIKKPEYLYKSKFTNIQENRSQVDYIAITHPIFKEAASEYVNTVQSLYSVETQLYTTEEIYNQYNYGYPYPESIKNFIREKYSLSDSPRPSYLVLIGDANYDYKSYRKKYSGYRVGENYVPSYGYPVSDNWYTVFDSSNFNIPQMFVGRIPINNSAQLEFYRNKLLNNEEQTYDEWNKRCILFSGGNASDPSEIRTFKQVNDKLIEDVIAPPPYAGNYTHFYKTTDPVSDYGPYSTEFIRGKIAEGGLFIAYLGHSGTATWDNGINNVSQLESDINKNNFITDFGCSTNKFAEPDIVAFGEEFVLNENSSSLGYVGNSNLGFTSTATASPKLFYSSIINDSLVTLGQAHYALKSKLFESFGESSVFKVFSYGNTILGDPAVQIKIPPKPNYSVALNDISFNASEISTSSDSAAIKVNVINNGRAISGIMAVLIKEFYLGNAVSEERYQLINLFNTDSLVYYLKSKDKPGIHEISVTLDPDNEIDEIYENDNAVSVQINVISNIIRDLLPLDVGNNSAGNIILLSPTNNLFKSDSIKIESADNPQFNESTIDEIPIDTFYTSYSLPNPFQGKRYWLRYKSNKEQNQWAKKKSVYISDGASIIMNDSISFNESELNGLHYTGQGISFMDDSVKISVISAGSSSGQYCTISKNGSNLLANTFFRGIGVVLFEPGSLDILDSKWYELFNNSQEVNNLTEFINSIDDSVIVAIGIAGDAKNNMSTDLRSAIVKLGSTKIDSVLQGAPWAMITQKNNDSFIVLEEYKKPDEGTVQINFNLPVNSHQGYIKTKEIKGVKELNRIRIAASGLEKSTFVRILGHKGSIVDTVFSQPYASEIVDFGTGINEYESYQFLFEFEKSSASDIGFNISGIEIDFEQNAELGLNYQVVSVNRDSIIQGGTNRLRFSVFNVGQSPAENFKVGVELLKPDNTTRLIEQYYNITVPSMAGREFELKVNLEQSDGWGNMAFNVSVDTDDNILEIYEDNNFYSIPFYVEEDTVVTSISEASFAVTFDGLDINDGEYISPAPEILIGLYYPSWFSASDTNAINFSINGEPVALSKMAVSNDAVNNQMHFSYHPKFNDGEYVLRIFGSDKTGQTQTLPSYEKMFLVSNELKIFDTYNYPNPFADETNFTFRLTNVPEELYVKIYTVAGRLIRELKADKGGLKTDFNYIPWDGRDEDGDLAANGVYLYRIYARSNGKSYKVTQKLAIVR